MKLITKDQIDEKILAFTENKGIPVEDIDTEIFVEEDHYSSFRYDGYIYRILTNEEANERYEEEINNLVDDISFGDIQENYTDCLYVYPEEKEHLAEYYAEFKINKMIDKKFLSTYGYEEEFSKLKENCVKSFFLKEKREIEIKKLSEIHLENLIEDEQDFLRDYEGEIKEAFIQIDYEKLTQEHYKIYDRGHLIADYDQRECPISYKNELYYYYVMGGYDEEEYLNIQKAKKYIKNFEE